MAAWPWGRHPRIASPRIAPIREAAASGDAPKPHSEFQRPGSRKGSGPFRLSFHFGCAPALRRRKTSRCTRRGMCAAGHPASCSETPPPTGGLARGHSRSGSLQVVFVQLARTPGFHSGYAGSNPAHGANNPKSRRRSRHATQTGRNDWAAPEPVTGVFCMASLTQRKSARLSSELSRVRVPHEAPVFLDVAEWSKAPGCKPGGVCPRWFESNRRVQCVVCLGVAVAQWQSRGL